MVDSSLARRTPTASGSRTVRPQPGMIPTRAWVSAKRARSEATRKSHASASSKPPVMATPLIAPITGRGHRRERARAAGVSARPSLGSAPVSLRAASPPAASSLRSSPAQNAGSAPVRTMAATSSRASSSRSVVGIALRSSRFSALRASGRLSVTVATGSVDLHEHERQSDTAHPSSSAGRKSSFRSPEAHEGRRDPAAHGGEVVVEDRAVGQGGLVELVAALVAHLERPVLGLEVVVEGDLHAWGPIARGARRRSAGSSPAARRAPASRRASTPAAGSASRSRSRCGAPRRTARRCTRTGRPSAPTSASRR